MNSFLSWPAALGLVAAFLITAALVRRGAPRERRRLKRVALFLAAYLLALGVSELAAILEWPRTMAVAGNVAGFVAWLALIEITALAVFKLLLPRLRVEWPSIVGDLFVGGAFLVLIVAGLRDVGVDPTSILATSAVVTAILALSLQATLGNIIGGVALQLDRSVRVGDWLQLDNGTQGRVREIRWRHTVIETRDWNTIIVPNSSLLAANIVILGKREDKPRQTRIWVYFNIDFRYRPTQVIQTVEEALRAPPAMPGVAQDPPPNCVCLDFANDARESYCLYAVRFWLTDLNQDDPTSSLVRQRLYAALRRASIPLAIPAAQIFIDQDEPERRERKRRRELDERLATLDSVEFLRVLNQDELEHVASALQPAPFSPGETIAHQGAEAHWLYILSEGEAEVRIAAGDFDRHVAHLKAPTFFGEMGLMTGDKRRATVIATTPVHCYKLHRDDFKQILTQRPAVAEEISTILATREFELQAVREDLDSVNREQRVGDASTKLLSRIRDFFGLAE